MTKWQALWKALLAVLESEVTLHVWTLALLGIAGVMGAGIGGWIGVGFLMFAALVVGIVAWAGKSDAS